MKYTVWKTEKFMMRKMSKTGFIRKNIFVFVIAIFNVIKADIMLGYDDMSAGIAEYILMFNGGTGGNMKLVPILLIAFIMYISVVAVEDCHNGPGYSDTAEVIRCGRRKWWLKRCLYSVADIITYIFTIAVVFLCAAHGKWSTGELAGKMIVSYFDKDIEYIYLGNLRFVVSGILTPMLMIIGIVLIVKALAVAVGSVISVISSCILMILAVWFCNPLIPGDYIMLMKHTFYIGKLGTNEVMGIIYSIFIMIIAFVGGSVFMSKKDILPSEK